MIATALAAACTATLSAAFAVAFAAEDLNGETPDGASIQENYTDVLNGTGTRITLREESGAAAFTYWNLLDAEDVLSGVPFADFIFTPEVMAENEASAVVITLEDFLDPTQQLSAAFRLADTYYTTPSTYGFASLCGDIDSEFRLTGTNQSIVGNHSLIAGYSAVGLLNVCHWEGNYYGLFSGTDANGEPGTRISNLSLRYAEHDLLAGINYYYGNLGTYGWVEHVLADLDSAEFRTAATAALASNDPVQAEYKSRYTDEHINNLFSSGRVKLSFKFYGVEDTVSFSLRAAGGVATPDVRDISEPVIDTAFTASALKGVRYPMPEVRVSDNFDENISLSTVTVTDPDGTAVAVTDHFVPEKAGTYTVTYVAVDEAGNSAEKSYKIECFGEMPEVEFTPAGSLQSSFYVYETMDIPLCTASSPLCAEPPATAAVLQLGNKVCASFYGNGPYRYQFTRPGVYSVYYLATTDMGVLAKYKAGEISVSDYPVILLSATETLCPVGGAYRPESPVCLYKGEEYAVSLSIVSPSGKQIENAKEITLTELGTYTFTYTAAVDGNTATAVAHVECVVTAGNLVEGDANITQIEYDYPQPEYTSAEGSGLYVVGAPTTTGTIRFTNKVDLNALDAGDNLIRLLPLAGEDLGKASYTVTLTDAYNDANTVSIVAFPHGSIVGYGYCYVNYDGRTLARYPDNNGEVHDWAGFGALVDGTYGQTPSDVTFSVQVDYAQKQFFTIAFGSQWMLLDTDDPSQVGTGREWKGFTTGEVYVSVTVTSQTEKASAFLVDELAGQSLSGVRIKDTTAPRLTFDYPQSFAIEGAEDDAEIMPKAAVGTAYPLPQATAYDLVSGECAVQYSLVLDGGTENLLPEQGAAAFTPERAGKYTYTVSASDVYGNVVSRTFVFTAYEQVDGITITIDDSEPAAAGYLYTLPGYTVSGGSGEVGVTMRVELNGAAVTPDALGRVYLYEPGVLTMYFTATDYIGSELVAGETKDITVEPGTLPVMDVSGIPDYAIAGDTLVLPDFTATDYNFGPDDESYTAFRQVKVNGTTVFSSNGERTIGSLLVDVPADAHELIVEYTAGPTAAEIGAVRRTVTIPVVDPKNLSDYFVPYAVGGNAANVTTDSADTGLAFIADGDTGLRFINPLSGEGLVLRFSGLAEAHNFEVLKVILTDYENDENRIELWLYDVNGATYIGLNGNQSLKPVGGSLRDRSSYVYLVYSGGNIVDDAGDTVLELDRTANGNVFNGFGGAVRLSFEICGVGKGSAESGTGASVNFLRIGNQTFSAGAAGSEFSDQIGPQIVTHGAIASGTYEIGTQVLLPAASAFDVLSTYSTVRLTVRFGASVLDGYRSIACDEPTSLTLEKYGYYNVLYDATDSNGQTSQLRFILNVKDTIAPEITLAGEIPAEAYRGETVSLPEASVQDNYSQAQLYILVAAPDGSVSNLHGAYEFVPELSGTYTIVYYAADEDYNTAIIKQTTTVRERTR